MLLQDLFEGHPEAMEGRPVLKIDLKQTEDRSALLIDLEMTGYLDDSVSGESTAPSWSRARSTCSGWRSWARKSNAAAVTTQASGQQENARKERVSRTSKLNLRS
jgi:hypothetical protein